MARPQPQSKLTLVVQPRRRHHGGATCTTEVQTTAALHAQPRCRPPPGAAFMVTVATALTAALLLRCMTLMNSRFCHVAGRRTKAAPHLPALAVEAADALLLVGEAVNKDVEEGVVGARHGHVQAVGEAR